MQTSDIPGLPLAIAELEVRGEGGRRLLSIDRLEIAPGSRVGIRGPSGAGKSTLLYALAGLVAISSGSVRWGDQDIATLPDRRRTDFRRRHIGMVFQDFLLFEELSAFGNATVAAMFCDRSQRARIDDTARRTLDRLGLADMAGRSVVRFSGGERQRVAVARAMANDPAILLADEPTASLDRQTADRLVADLTEVAAGSGRTLIAVSHDAALLSRMDRVLDLADGRLVADADSDVSND